MITKLTIKNRSNEILQVVTFDDQKIMNDFIDMIRINKTFGEPEYQKEISAELVMQDGTIIPARFETIPSEYVLESMDITYQVEQEKINQDALNYLSSTDWLVVRFAETGESVPGDILLERAQARLRIVRP